MKLKNIILLSLLLTSCDLTLPNNSLNNNSDINKFLCKETFEAYYDNSFTSSLSEMLMFKTNSGPAFLSNSINPSSYGIYNIIEGDKITIYANEILFQETYPATICAYNIGKIEIEEIPVYEFEVVLNENNEFYLYCLDNDSTYTLDNKQVYYSNDRLLSNNLELYDNMKLYGSMIDNKINNLYKYNPRIKQYNHYKSLNNESFLLLEKENNKGIFMNNDFMIATDISKFSNLVKGNEYLIDTGLDETLITNLKEVQYISKPQNITINKENINDSTIDIGIIYIQDNYDNMPRYDDFNDGTVTFPHIYMNSSFNIQYYHLENPTSFTKLIKNDLFLNSNSRVFNNYIGLNFLKNENKEKHLIDNEKIISEDCLLFYENGIEINYM